MNEFSPIQKDLQNENNNLKNELSHLQEMLKAHDINSALGEEALTQERNHLRTLIDNIPDYIYFKDREHKFIDANAATVRFMRQASSEELKGKTDFDFYPKEYAQKYYNDEVKLFNSGVTRIDIEEVSLNEQGEDRVISTTKVALKDRQGNIIGLVGIGRDITDRKRAEEILKRDKETFERMVEQRTQELIKIRSEYERAKRLSDIGTLAATVAHELRNPLGVIQMATYNLKRDKVLAENKHVKNIEKKVWEGSRIIDNLLSYARIKIPFYEKVNIFNLIEDSIANVHALFAHDPIVFEKHYDIDQLSVIEVDPHQIKEVLNNVLTNACQALPNKTGKVELYAKIDEGQLRIIIKDNGTGIDKEDLDKIFMPFFTRKSKGTGLGLAICNELVNLHHGKISFDSKKGEGTTVSIFLPLKNHSPNNPTKK